MKRNPDAKTDTPASPEDGFLRRWSRQKSQARHRAEAVGSDAAPLAKTEPEAKAPMLTDADMPPVESLTPDSDFRPFLSPGISEELQRLALRRLFQSPAFNELCPLEGEYFDAQGYKPLGKLITHEMRAQLKREAAKLKEKAHAALESTAVDEQVPSNKPARAPGATAASPRDTRARAPRTDKLTRVSTRHPARARKS